MRRARLAALLLCVTLGAALLPVVPAGAAPPAAPACDPVLTPPELAGQVPTAEEVIGFPLGERDVTVAESDAYLQAVADASPRVTAGTAAVSWQGRPLRYAIVGRPGNVTKAGLARIRSAAPCCATRGPRPKRPPAWPGPPRPSSGWPATSTATRRAAPTPRCGSLGAGRPARLRGRPILDNAIVVLLPTQNPDGREADTRRNAYGFDMNRDWFARTQPETDGKLELLRRSRRCCSSTPTRWAGRASSSRRTPTPSTTRSPTSRWTGSTTSTGRPWPGSSPAAASTSSTATSTTCSTWGTATPCPPPGSSRPG